MEIKRDRYLNKLISYMWDGQVKVNHRHPPVREVLPAAEPVPPLPGGTGVPEDRILTFALDLTRDIRYRDPLELAGRVREMVEGKEERFYLFVDEIQMSDRSSQSL